jgi:hypothetical protein
MSDIYNRIIAMKNDIIVLTAFKKHPDIVWNLFQEVYGSWLDPEDQLEVIKTGLIDQAKAQTVASLVMTYNLVDETLELLESIENLPVLEIYHLPNVDAGLRCKYTNVRNLWSTLFFVKLLSLS